MLTARDEDVDKIIGLEVGADDYLTKPFNPRELVARIKSILRRAAPERRELETEVIAHGDLRVDAGRREARVGDEEIQLAPKEFDLLWELLDHRGLVLTRDQLLERVWGYTFAGDTRTVDVHVRQLRRKLGDASPIVTVWGVGYKVSTARETAEGRRPGLERTPWPCSRPSASGCRSSSSPASCSRARHDADRDPALPRLRAPPDAPRASPRGGRASRSSTRARSRPTSARRARASRAGRRRSRGWSSSTRPATRSTSTARSSPFPGENSGLPQLNLNNDRLDVRRGADVRVHAAAPDTAPTTRSRTRSTVGETDDRRDRRREAEDGRQPVRRTRSCGGSRSRCAFGLLVAGGVRARTSRAASCGRCSRSRDAADEVADGQLRRRAAARGRRARSAIWPSGSTR